MLNEIREITAVANKENLECHDIMRCVFNLTGTDMLALRTLEEDKDSTAAEVGEAIGRDRSTAHRSLEKLVSCGLSAKERRPGKPRGYSCVYRKTPQKLMYTKTQERLDTCYCKLREALSKGD